MAASHTFFSDPYSSSISVFEISFQVFTLFSSHSNSRSVVYSSHFMSALAFVSASHRSSQSFRRTRGSPLFSHTSLSGPGPGRCIGGPGETVSQTTTWASSACPEHDVTGSGDHTALPAGQHSPTARLSSSVSKGGTADGGKRDARETKVTTTGLPDRTVTQAEIPSLTSAALFLSRTSVHMKNRIEARSQGKG